MWLMTQSLKTLTLLSPNKSNKFFSLLEKRKGLGEVTVGGGRDLSGAGARGEFQENHKPGAHRWRGRARRRPCVATRRSTTWHRRRALCWEHCADQPDAERSQPRGLGQCAGERRQEGDAAWGGPAGGPQGWRLVAGTGLPALSQGRPRGCAAARTEWCSGWSRTSGDAAAAELTGAVGGLAGRRREPGAQALPGQHRLPQGRQLFLLKWSFYRCAGWAGSALALQSLGQGGPEKAPPLRGGWG